MNSRKDIDRRGFIHQSLSAVGAAGLASAVNSQHLQAAQLTRDPTSKTTPTLKGRFVYDGEAPKRSPIKITKDVDYCGKCKLLEEDLVVDAKTKGIANIIVWLYTSSRDPQPPMDASYKQSEKATVGLDSTQCSIVPHVTLLRTTQTLLVRNTDPIGDGIKIDLRHNPPINVMLEKESEVSFHFPKPERMPVRVSCPIHPWESGWLVLLSHPYMAATDVEGNFEIKHLPVGDWTFVFWHEKAGYVSQARQNNQEVAWQRGRVKIKVEEGVHDLGTLVLSPSLFDK